MSRGDHDGNHDGGRLVQSMLAFGDREVEVDISNQLLST